MVPLVFEIKITGQGIQKRNLNRYIQLSLKTMLFEWFLRFFPLKFRRTAFSRYPGVFTKRGRRRKIHNPRPNFRTGRMKKLLEQSFRVFGTPKLMRAVMTGPAYTDIASSGGGGKQPDKANEIAWVSEAEERHLAQVFADTFVALINNNKETKTTRIR